LLSTFHDFEIVVSNLQSILIFAAVESNILQRVLYGLAHLEVQQIQHRWLLQYVPRHTPHHVANH
ncbi:MAG TPA: hypothetical protein VIG82_04990, partial [Enteractinococcus sp.]